MSSPAYLWLIDDAECPIVGSCQIPSRLGAIEVKSFTHNVSLPADHNTGRLTGTRIHCPIVMRKEFDRVTPFLYRALCEGRTLKSATLKMYHTIDSGMEMEYFNINLTNVKITSITPDLFPSGATGTHFEEIEFRYESIEWKYVDGNILFQDSWNQRVVA